MINLSKNLKIFSLLFVFYTLCFRYFLSLSITSHNGTMQWSTAIIYGLLIFITAWILGKNEDITIGIIDLGFKYHFVTYVIFNTIALLWHFSEFSSNYETVEYVVLVIITWGILLAIHLFFHLIARKNTIKGVPGDQIFE